MVVPHAEATVLKLDRVLQMNSSAALRFLNDEDLFDKVRQAAEVQFGR